jgi:hypothetical protein
MTLYGPAHTLDNPRALELVATRRQVQDGGDVNSASEVYRDWTRCADIPAMRILEDEPKRWQ